MYSADKIKTRQATQAFSDGSIEVFLTYWFYDIRFYSIGTGAAKNNKSPKRLKPKKDASAEEMSDTEMNFDCHQSF